MLGFLFGESMDKKLKACVVDIESSGLLDESAINYLQMPYRLKPSYQVYCIVFRDIRTGKHKSLHGADITKANVAEILEKFDTIVGHNIVNFDLPALKLADLLDYRIGYPGEPSVINGRIVEIYDTLIWSKLLNADRFGGKHSLEVWGEALGVPKTKFYDFSQFSQEMLDYCIQDTNTNRSLYFKLQEEIGDWDWGDAYSMEVKLADLTMKQAQFGFAFNSQLAEKNLQELNSMMQVIAAKVDPILPPKPLNQLTLGSYTPPARRFKANGEPSAFLLKFCAKHSMELNLETKTYVYDGKTFDATKDEPIKTHEAATVDDIDIVKGLLLSYGWEPSEVKERDLSKNADKTVRTYKEVIETIDRYVKQTQNSVFKDLRLEILDCTMDTLWDTLVCKISIRDGKVKPLWVPSTPKLTVGLEKEICPNLLALGEKAEFVKDVVHYFTYRHRRNAIAGGALDEDGEPITGFLSAVREDGRIPTPADTLGANTGRYRHRIVCNVPRVTSLFGEPMRNLFGSGEGLWELGYDFASLEARIMGHYVMPYTDGVNLAQAMLAEKPNDIHSVNGKKLGISRTDAKSFSYAAIYGAQPKKLAKMLNITVDEAKKLFEDYWNAVPALKELKEKVEKSWENSGKSFILGLDGRKLMTRSKHSLINVLFQSGGAISAKWAAVRLAQEAERLNILGDPFVHTKADPKIWFMIHVHDEQQLAVHSSLLNVKLFPTEEEAKAYRTDNRGAIGHSSKGYYVTNKTAPVECISFGIEQAKKELNLRVDLGFEYISGKTWAQCH
jgi:hypothetical protein